MGEISVRAALIADASAIASVHVRGWRVGYQGIVPDAVLEALSVEQHERDWAKRLGGDHRSANASSTLVAECGGEVAGFATIVAPGRDEDLAPQTCELAALYVAPERWREGVGRALLRESMAAARADGWSEVVAWVLVENDAARAFYQRLGFGPDGALQVHDRSGESVIRLRAGLRG
jgi:ribosomal protein S18 acetylase RimI-like enzyme